MLHLPSLADDADERGISRTSDENSSSLSCFPFVISKIFSSCYTTMSYEELITLGRTYTFDLDLEAIIEIERRTRQQARCDEWFNFRCGRITGSTMKQVCCVRSSTSNRTLIEKICNNKNITSPAIRWGKANEEVSSNYM